MVTIKNSQRKIKINARRIKGDVQKILSKLGYDDFDIGIWFTTDQTIKKYNKKYRKKDKATDILSFPYHPDLKPGKKIVIKNPEDKNLGDIIISLERVKHDVGEEVFEEYLKKIIVHGIVHLVGYDHKTEKDYKIMNRKELELLG
jgi:rRNA maturation RNase YbeY